MTIQKKASASSHGQAEPSSMARIMAELGQFARAGPVIPSSTNDEERSFEVVMSTGADVLRYDWEDDSLYYERLRMDAAAVRMARIEGGPVVDSHNIYAIEAILGRVCDVRLDDKGQMIGRVYFVPGVVRADEAYQKIRHSSIRSVSIGYRVHKWVDAGTQDGYPVREAVDWEPYEVSLVAVPADAGARFRADPGVIVPNDINVENQETEGKRKMTPEELAKAEQARIQKAIEDDRVRAADIKKAGEQHRIDSKVVDEWVRGGLSVAEANTRILGILQERTAAAEKQSPLPGNPASVSASDQNHRIYASPKGQDEQPGMFFARSMLAVAGAHGAKMNVADYARDVMKDANLEADFRRGLTTGLVAGGGAMIPEQQSNEVIELLRGNTVIRKAGARSVAMNGGNLTIPRQTGGASATYRGEAQNAAVGDVTFGSEKLTAKILDVIVIVSDQMVRYPSVSAQQMVRDDAINAIAQAEDYAFLRGTGTEYSPLGLLNKPGIASFTAKASVTAFQDVLDDLAGAKKRLKPNADNEALRPVWFITPDAETYLMSRVGSEGQPTALASAMLANKTILGIPYFVSSKLPYVAGTSADFALVDMSDVIIGDTLNYQVSTSQEATITVGGQPVNLFQSGQMAIRVTAEHDIGLRHPTSVVWGRTAKWVI